MNFSCKEKLEDKNEFILTLSDIEEGARVKEEDLGLVKEEPKKKKRKLDPFSILKTKTKKKKRLTKINGSKIKGTNGLSKVKDGVNGSEEEDVFTSRESTLDDDDNRPVNFELELDLNFEDLEDEGTNTRDFDGWGFESIKQGFNTNTKTASTIIGSKKSVAVDIEDILLRRREKRIYDEKKRNLDGEITANISDPEFLPDETEKVEGVNEGNDEFLAEDGFGMGVNLEDEESITYETESLSSDNDEDDSVKNSVASSVSHPYDINVRSDSSSESREDSDEESARNKVFFAPEEKPKTGGKNSASKESSKFHYMSLSRPILRGLADVGFSKPTPIQAKTIPVALLGKDIVGGAVTGSGKTAAFLVPILERLIFRPRKVSTSRVAILTPTRELAIQCHAVAVKLASYTDIKFCLVVGGLSLKSQEVELRLRPDVIIGTPGRFIDHMRNSLSFTVDTLEILVLDEADRMLEAGFADELNEIVTTIPKSRQTMLFSATMTSSIDNLIRVGLNKPVRLLVDNQKQTVSTLTQEFVRLRPGRETKRMAYLLYLCKNTYTHRVIIFFKQKKIAHRARVIFGLSELKAAELHGAMSQEQRILSVEAFREGKVSFLLATDLASRGLDIKGVDTVINFEVPQSYEIYLHRVGRTARAGRSGVACTLAAEPDRKVVKLAVKSGRSHNAKIVSRVIDTNAVDALQDQLMRWDDEIEAILQEEKEEKQLAQLEMQVQKGQNVIQHESEIMARPKRTWFESKKDKKAAQRAGKIELNGILSNAKEKKDPRKNGVLSGSSKLSNKIKKKLRDKDIRVEGRVWRKGRAEREGKGAAALVRKEFHPKKRRNG